MTGLWVIGKKACYCLKHFKSEEILLWGTVCVHMCLCHVGFWCYHSAKHRLGSIIGNLLTGRAPVRQTKADM